MISLSRCFFLSSSIFTFYFTITGIFFLILVAFEPFETSWGLKMMARLCVCHLLLFSMTWCLFAKFRDCHLTWTRWVFYLLYFASSFTFYLLSFYFSSVWKCIQKIVCSASKSNITLDLRIFSSFATPISLTGVKSGLFFFVVKQGITSIQIQILQFQSAQDFDT